MALLEVNLEKPALVEEYQFPAETPAVSDKTAESGKVAESEETDYRDESSGSGKGKLLGLLALVAGVGLLVWKLKRRGSDEQEVEFGEEEYEHGPEPDIGADESGGAKRKVAGLLGLVVAVVSLVGVVRKRRS